MAIAPIRVLAKPQTTPPPAAPTASPPPPASNPAASSAPQKKPEIKMENDCGGADETGQPISTSYCTVTLSSSNGTPGQLRLNRKDNSIVASPGVPLTDQERQATMKIAAAVGSISQTLIQSPKNNTAFAEWRNTPFNVTLPENPPGTHREVSLAKGVITALLNFNPSKISESIVGSGSGSVSGDMQSLVEGLVKCAREGKETGSWLAIQALFSAELNNQAQFKDWGFTDEQIKTILTASQTIVSTPAGALFAKFVKTTELLMNDFRARNPDFVNFASEVLQYVMVVDPRADSTYMKNAFSKIPPQKREDYARAIAKALEDGFDIGVFNIHEDTEKRAEFYEQFEGVDFRMRMFARFLIDETKIPVTVHKKKKTPQTGGGMPLWQKVAIAGGGLAVAGGIAAFVAAKTGGSSTPPPGTLKPTKGGTGPKTQQEVIIPIFKGEF